MIWAIYCIDVENSRSLRDAFRLEHRAFLESYVPRIFFSGPLWDDELFDQKGSLFLIDLDSRGEAIKFVTEEPYNKNGVFTEVSMHPMTKGKFNGHLLPKVRERPDPPGAVEQ